MMSRGVLLFPTFRLTSVILIRKMFVKAIVFF